MEKENKKREIALADVIKFIGVIGIVTPLLLGYFQYQQSVQQDKDNSFRVWVEKLSSDKKAERLSAATNLGTYLKADDDYYEEALDILINTVSMELDYNVLNAIRGSLEKVGVSERRRINQKILNLDRDLFNFNYALRTRLDSAKQNLLESYGLIMDVGILVGNKSIDTIILNSLEKDLKIKNEIKINVEQDYNELSAHQLMIASFISLSLNLSRSKPIDSLSFYQNSFNYLSWLNLKLPNSRMENSAFSAMALSNVDFSGSEIIGNSFAHSSFSNCSFAESEIIATNFNQINAENEIDFSRTKFDDVFFLGSNLKNSNFKGAVGLEPVYFYGVQALDSVQFDDEFRMKLEKELIKIQEEEFKEYVKKSKLIKLRKDELLEALKPITINY